MTAFRCPDCGSELWPLGISVAWRGGGATKYQCMKCRKEFWYVSGYGYIPGDEEPPRVTPYLNSSSEDSKGQLTLDVWEGVE